MSGEHLQTKLLSKDVPSSVWTQIERYILEPARSSSFVLRVLSSCISLPRQSILSLRTVFSPMTRDSSCRKNAKSLSTILHISSIAVLVIISIRSLLATEMTEILTSFKTREFLLACKKKKHWLKKRKVSHRKKNSKFCNLVLCKNRK